MKRKFIITCFLFICFCAFTQVAVDVLDPFYEDVKIWENMRLINDTPSVRPYPLQEVKRILEIIIETGDEGQKKIAEDHYNRFFGRAFHFGGKTEFTFKFPDKDYEIILSPVMDLNYEIHKYLTISANINAYLTNKLPSNSPQPAFMYSKHDLASDDVKVGKLYFLPVFNSGLSIGTPEYYFTANIARTDYGPFYKNNIIIGSHALHQGQFNFAVNKPKWTYEQTFLTLSPTDDTGRSWLNPNKFLVAHSLNIRPLPWLSFGLVDSVIYGGRFEPIYLLPFSAFFVSQGLYGFPDNSLIGAMFTVKPIDGLRFDGVLYTDDIGFNEIIKFEKDAKWRLAGQFGTSYTMPKTHWFTSVDFHYTFVTPYTYTHYDGNSITSINYQNYTHAGTPLGSNLPPNSDRIYLKLKFRPVHGLSINLSETFIRHGNVSESIEDVSVLRAYFSQEHTTDGSVFNHSYAHGAGTHSFLYSTPFMKQKTIQYVNQLNLETSYTYPFAKSGGNMQFKIGYTFEANINGGINSNIYKKTDTVLSSDVEIKKEQERQHGEWKKNAVGKQFNHFFNFAIKITY
ncbi:hypothetical protein [Treponema pedis]|uniref:hypothetical protein n=1 Tax=Treponema pedis TaxID=409322 RepID=UPI0004277E62|nr:hypothetical protein [Treponema pedis]